MATRHRGSHRRLSWFRSARGRSATFSEEVLRSIEPLEPRAMLTEYVHWGLDVGQPQAGQTAKDFADRTLDAYAEILEPQRTQPAFPPTGAQVTSFMVSFTDRGSFTTLASNVVVTLTTSSTDTLSSTATFGEDYRLWFVPQTTTGTLVWSAKAEIAESLTFTMPAGYAGYGSVFVEALVDDKPVQSGQLVDPREGLETVVLTIASVNGLDNKLNPYVVHPYRKGELAVISDYQSIDSDITPEPECNCSCEGCQQVTVEPTTRDGNAQTTQKVAPNLSMLYSGDRSTTQQFPIKGFTAYFPPSQAPALVEAKLYLNKSLVETLYLDYDQASENGSAINAISDKISFTLQAKLAETLTGTGKFDWRVEFRYGSNVGGVFQAKKTAADPLADIIDNFSGVHFYVDRESSQFGRGWGVPGLDRLHLLDFPDPQTFPFTQTNTKGLLLGGGDGADFFFEEIPDGFGAVTYKRAWGDTQFRRIERFTDPDFPSNPTPGATFNGYRVIDKYETIQAYDWQGLLRYVKDRNGNKTAYNRGDIDDDVGVNVEGYKSIVDPFGQTTTFNYTKDTTTGLYYVTQIIDANGGATNFTFQDGYLRLVSGPDGDHPDEQQQRPLYQTSFEYNASDEVGGPRHKGFLKSIREHASWVNPATFISNPPTPDPADRVWSVTYDRGLGVATLINSEDGSAIEFQATNPKRFLTERPEADSGSLAKAARFNRVIQEPWDSSGDKPEEEIVTGASERITGYEKEDDFEKNFRTDRFGNSTFISYIDNKVNLGRDETFNRDGDGLILTHTESDPVKGTRQTSFTYDGTTPPGPSDWNRKGNLTTETLPNGMTRHWDYGFASQVDEFIDEYGRKTTYVLDAQNGNALSRTNHTIDGQIVTNFTYTDPPTSHNEFGAQPQVGGLMKTLADPAGTITFRYHEGLDHHGQLKEIEFPATPSDGAGGPGKQTFDWNGFGQLISFTDEVGNTTTYLYDAIGRATEIKLPEPDTSTIGVAAFTTYEYNRLSRIVRKRELDPATGTTWDGTSGGRTTTFGYTFDTGLHHTIMTATEPPLNGAAVVSQYTFDHHGNLVGVRDPLLRKTDYKYNHFHELEQIKVLGTGASAIQQTDYAYDAWGRLTSLKRLVTGTPGGGNAPTVSSPTGTLDVNTAVSKQEVDLSAIFSDTEDNDSTLRLVIEANSNPNLFESIAITAGEPRKLILTFAEGVTTPVGTPAALQIRGYDSAGNSVLHTLNVTRNAASATPVLVNSYTTGSQSVPRIATMSDGSYVVVWLGEGQGVTSGVWARLYKPDGTPNGDQFLVSVNTTETHLSPTVASNGTNFIVGYVRNGWFDPAQTNRYQGFARVFSGSTPLTGEITLYEYDAYFTAVEVEALGDGRFLAVWRNYNLATSNYELKVQAITSGGATIGSPMIVNLAGYGNGDAYSAGGTADGDFLLTWRSGTTLYARRFTSEGTPVSNVVQVNLGGTVNWSVTADGGFVVAWEQTTGVFVRRFSVDGTPVGSLLLLGSGNLGWIDTTADGGYAVTRHSWSSEIYLRRFDANGNSLGTATVVATGAPGGQNRSSIAYLAGGGIALAFHAAGAGDANDIFTRQIEVPATLPPSGTFRLTAAEPAANLVGPVDRVLLSFSDPVDLASLQTAGAVTLLNPSGTPITITAIEQVSKRQYNVRFAAQSAVGNYSLTLAASIAKQGGGATLGSPVTQIFNVASPAMRLDGPGQSGAAATEVEFKFDYDTIDRLTKITDPLNNDTSFAYAVVNPTGTFEQLQVTVTRPVVGASEYWYDWYDRVGMVYVRSMHPTQPLAEYDYDTAGDLVKAFDALRNETDFDYDARHRLVTITEPAPGVGQPRPVTTYLYDAAGQLLMETDPLGRQTGYRYNQLGQVRRLLRAKPDGTNAGLIVAPGDGTDTPIGPYTDLKYDATGNLRQMSEADAGLGVPVTDYDYDVAGNLKKITLPAPLGTGTRPIYNYKDDVAGQLVLEGDALNRITSYAYDGAGRLTSFTAFDSGGSGPGNTTAFAYDGLDNVVRVTDPLGRVTQHGYDPLSRLTHTIDAMGGISTSRYDAAGRMTETTDELARTTKHDYDVLDRLTKITHPHADSTATGPDDEYGYDLAGNLITSKDWIDKETHYKYDNLHRLEFVYQPNPLTGLTVDGGGAPLGPDTQFFYDAADQLTQVKDPLDRYTAYDYDKLGRRSKLTQPNRVTGAADGPLTEYTFDALDRLTEIKAPDPDGAGGSLPRPITKHVFDNLGRGTQLIEPDPATGLATGPTTDFTYNLADDLLTVQEPTITTSTGSQVRRTTNYLYDAHRRVIQATVSGTGATSQITKYAYDRADNLLSVRDPAGFSTFTTYDALDRPTTVVDTREGTTRFGYDAVGNRTSLTDPRGNTTAWTFDRLDRVKSETNALGDARQFFYDVAGNLDKRVDREGRVRAFDYDFLNRQVKEEWFASLSDPTADRTMDFNLDWVGQLEAASDCDTRAADFDFHYDLLGRMDWAKWDALTDVQFTLRQSFDDMSRRTKASLEYAHSNGSWTKGDFENVYGYDALSRMTSIVQKGQALSGSGVTNNVVGEKRVDLTYNALDQIETIIRRSGTLQTSPEVFTTTQKYDPLARLVSIVHQKTGSAAFNTYSFAFDTLNRLTSMISADGTSTFNYDSTSQVISADHTNGSGLPTDESYVHDLNGNRVTANGSTYSTGTNNQVLNDGTHTYLYDKEGNRISRTRISDGQYTEYRYDHRNQLTFVGVKTSQGAGTYLNTVEYVYDLFNRREHKIVDSDGSGGGSAVTTTYMYDGESIVLTITGDSAANFTLNQRFLHGPNIDQVLAQENATTNAVQWMAADQLGTVRDMTDNSGTAILHATFGAFGQLVNVTNSQGIPYLFGYTGREWDAETGLWFYRARYYDPSIGRFLQEDPIGFAAGDTNLARYVGNHPTISTDPMGTQETPKGPRDWLDHILQDLWISQAGSAQEQRALALAALYDALQRQLTVLERGNTSGHPPGRAFYITNQGIPRAKEIKEMLGLIGEAYCDQGLDSVRFRVWRPETVQQSEPEWGYGLELAISEYRRRLQEFERFQRVRSQHHGLQSATSPLDIIAGFARLPAASLQPIISSGTIASRPTIGQNVRRFFWDPRNFDDISADYWAIPGPANGRSLHHWLFQQADNCIPQGIRNAGFNLFRLAPFRGVFHPTLDLNTWMGFAPRWLNAASVDAIIVQGAITVGIPGFAGAVGYSSYLVTSRIIDVLFDSGR